MDYHGNVPYCYANGVAMLLSARGERVCPGLVEVLTGIGLGAVRTPDGRTWFSSTQREVPARRQGAVRRRHGVLRRRLP